MKYEMTVAERKRRKSGPPTLEQVLQEADITDADRNEVRKFANFLRDEHNGMTHLDAIEKYGAGYFGYSPDEVAALKAAHQGPDQ